MSAQVLEGKQERGSTLRAFLPFLPLPCSDCPSCLCALLGSSLFRADHWPGQQASRCLGAVKFLRGVDHNHTHTYNS